PSDGFDGLSGHFFRLLPIQKKRPEQVGAFAWAFISVFSHSLFGRSFFARNSQREVLFTPRHLLWSIT
ncbi:hypothetical protein, partial [Pseudomonas cannabina]|uniref:hypothetical protein n=1 Tax=Pseudomonas cannabina TaxID=86840 RepID=UPI001CC2DA18